MHSLLSQGLRTLQIYLKLISLLLVGPLGVISAERVTSRDEHVAQDYDEADEDVGSHENNSHIPERKVLLHADHIKGQEANADHLNRHIGEVLQSAFSH